MPLSSRLWAKNTGRRAWGEPQSNQEHLPHIWHWYVSFQISSRFFFQSLKFQCLYGMSLSYHFKANPQPSHQITTSTQEDRCVTPVPASPLIHGAFAKQVKTCLSQSFWFFSHDARIGAAHKSVLWAKTAASREPRCGQSPSQAPFAPLCLRSRFSSWFFS